MIYVDCRKLNFSQADLDDDNFVSNIINAVCPSKINIESFTVLLDQID